jgi:AraC-like DNA-binding protein
MLKKCNERFMSDFIDIACEKIIILSVSLKADSKLSENHRKILEIESYISTNFSREIDFEMLSYEQGMHIAAFRRFWKKYIGGTPGNYVISLKMREAAHRLVETEDPVGMISHDVGYADELYFSRIFRKIYGMTATQYRKQHRIISE